MIITIARQCGCMGDQIGKALAEKYFIPFYDKDAVCRLAKEKGLYEKYPYFYGEMPLDMMLYADTMAGTLQLSLRFSLRCTATAYLLVSNSLNSRHLTVSYLRLK